MKKAVSALMAIVLFISVMLPALQTVKAESIFTVDEIGKEAKKVINVVYDDSGSMVMKPMFQMHLHMLPHGHRQSIRLRPLLQ